MHISRQVAGAGTVAWYAGTHRAVLVELRYSQQDEAQEVVLCNTDAVTPHLRNGYSIVWRLVVLAVVGYVEAAPVLAHVL